MQQLKSGARFQENFKEMADASFVITSDGSISAFVNRASAVAQVPSFSERVCADAALVDPLTNGLTREA
jgi:hypothetical protein